MGYMPFKIERMVTEHVGPSQKRLYKPFQLYDYFETILHLN